MLAENASLGVLKISEFVEQMKDMLPDISINDALASIKAGYIKRMAYFQINDPSVLDNMSTSQEVMAYQPTDAPRPIVQPEPQPDPLYKRMQDRFNSDQSKIIPNISTHNDVFVQDEDGVHIYKNIQSINHT